MTESWSECSGCAHSRGDICYYIDPADRCASKGFVLFEPATPDGTGRCPCDHYIKLKACLAAIADEPPKGG